MTLSIEKGVHVEIARGKRLSPVATSSVEMPTTGPLVDTFGRIHSDIRLSITDRCNFRCTYCMPEEGLEFLPRQEILSFEEITRIARIGHDLGIQTIRLTGGEPLIRKGVVELVRQLNTIGFDDIALTTNGSNLERLAPDLVAAGLQRVNISCDSLQPDRFAQIRRRGDLATVLASMAAAEAAGLSPIKVNVVLIKGENDDEVVDFARFARETGRIVRFIEFMPLDADGEWQRDMVVPGDEVVQRINDVFPLEEVGGSEFDAAPATRFRFADGAGEIGVVSSVTRPFCATCNRLRLTADGSIRNCLFSDDELSIRNLIRAGGSDEEVGLLLRSAVWGKLPGHGINDENFLRTQRSMSMIGG